MFEMIAKETAEQILGLKKLSWPKTICLYGANPKDLVKIMIALEDRFKKKRYNPEIFIGKGEGYKLNVEHYIKQLNSQKVS